VRWGRRQIGNKFARLAGCGAKLTGSVWNLMRISYLMVAKISVFERCGLGLLNLSPTYMEARVRDSAARQRINLEGVVSFMVMSRILTVYGGA